MSKILAIIGKEWAEVFKNRMVLFTVAFLPLIFTALPLVSVILIGTVEDAADLNMSGGGMDAFYAQCGDLTEVECAQLFSANLFTIMFMILPVAIPVTIAAYSIVGEKTTRSLEPLLATPVTTLELLAGKGLAAVIPALVATWLSYLIYVLALRFFAADIIFSSAVAPEWLLAIFVVGPLLTVASVSFAIMVSSRVSDPRVAEQIATVVILPIILLIVGQAAGFLLINQQVIVALATFVALLDILLLLITVRTFQREAILTRWK